MWATALKDGVQVGRGFATLAATTARRHHLRHSTLPPSELQIVAIVVMAAGAMGLADDLAEFVLDNGGTRVLGESVMPKIFDVGEGSQRLKWLSMVALQRYEADAALSSDGDIYSQVHVATGLMDAEGSLLPPNKSIRVALTDGQEVFALLQADDDPASAEGKRAKGTSLFLMSQGAAPSKCTKANSAPVSSSSATPGRWPLLISPTVPMRTVRGLSLAAATRSLTSSNGLPASTASRFAPEM